MTQIERDAEALVLVLARYKNDAHAEDMRGHYSFMDEEAGQLSQLSAPRLRDAAEHAEAMGWIKIDWYTGAYSLSVTKDGRMHVQGGRKAALPIRTGAGPTLQLELAWITDPVARGLLDGLRDELEKCANAGAPLACVILCGAIAEGALEHALVRHQATASRAVRAPNRDRNDPSQWRLASMIDVAADLGLIPPDRENAVDQMLREFRNMVHPSCLRRLRYPTTHDAELAIAWLRAALGDLAAHV